MRGKRRKQKIEALRQILKILQKTNSIISYENIGSYGRDQYITSVIQALLPYLPSELLQETLPIVREIEDEDVQALALSAILSAIGNRLPEVWSKVLRAAQEIELEDDQAQALSQIVSRVPEEFLPEILPVVRELGEYSKVKILEVIASRVPEEFLPKILQIAREIEHKFLRVQALSKIAPRMPEVWSEALRAAQEIELEDDQAQALSQIVSRVPEEFLPEILPVVRELGEYSKIEILEVIVSRVPEEFLPEILPVVRELGEYLKIETLEVIGSRVPEEFLPEILQIARDIEYKYFRSLVLSKIAARMPEVWSEALRAAQEIELEDDRGFVLIEMASRVPEEFLPEVLQTAREIEEEYVQVGVLSKIGLDLPEELLTDAIQVAQAIQKCRWGRSLLLAHILEYQALFPQPLLQKLLKLNFQFRKQIVDFIVGPKRQRLPRYYPMSLEVSDYFTDSMSLEESDFNSGFIEDLKSYEMLISEVAPSLRYADLTFWFDKSRNLGQKVPFGQTLQVGHWYQLEVAVREKPEGMPTEDRERRPIREPKQQQPVTVLVTAESDSFEITEPVKTLILPPQGNSIEDENAYFRVRPLQQSANANDLSAIRVRTYYQFNLLEVDVIHAEVVGQFDDPSQSRLGLDRSITFKQERLEREYLDFDDIEPRAMHVDICKQNNRFVFNFAFFNEADQKVEFTAPINLPTTDLEDALLNVRQIWHDISMSETFATQLEEDEDEFIENIRKLAKAGRNLWTKLFKQNLDSAMFNIGKWLEEHPLKPGAIIQVSQADNAADFVFPWALLYDRKVPRKDYELPAPQGFWGL